MITRVRFTAHIAIDTGHFDTPGGLGAEEQMIEPQTGVAFPAAPHVIPEGIHGLIRIERADGIHPTLIQDSLEGSARLRLDEGVLRVRGHWINILRCGYDIIVACQHHRHASPVKLQGMAREALQPSKLVGEFRPRQRIAVRCIQRGDDHAVDGGFDVAALPVLGITRQFRAGHDRLDAAREDGDTIP